MTTATDGASLLPCPFCGGPAKCQFDHEAGSKDCWEVECKACDFNLWGPYAPSASAKQAAMDRWNTRVSPAGDEDVERVARAICEAHGLRPWDHLTADGQLAYKKMALAALAALRPAAGEAGKT